MSTFSCKPNEDAGNTNCGAALHLRRGNMWLATSVLAMIASWTWAFGRDGSGGLELWAADGFRSDIDSVMFTADSKAVVVGTRIVENADGYGVAQFRDTETGGLLRSVRWPISILECVSLSPDGTLVAAGGDNADNGLGAGYLIDVQSGEVRLRATHGTTVRAVAFSPDGKILATAGTNTVKLHDVTGRTRSSQIEQANGRFRGVAFSPDSKAVATAGLFGQNGETDGADIGIWDTNTRQLLSRMSGHKGQVTSVAYSPDGKTLASGSWDGTIRFWDAATGRLKSTIIIPKAVIADAEDDAKKAKKSYVNCVAYSPDGRIVAAGTYGKVISLFSVADGKEIITLTGHKGIVWSVAISPDGTRLASGSEDKTVKLWDFAQISVGIDVNALAAEVRAAGIAAEKAEELADILDNAAKAFSNEKFDAGVDRLDHFRKKLSKAGLPADLTARWDAAAGKLIDRAQRKK